MVRLSSPNVTNFAMNVGDKITVFRPVGYPYFPAAKLPEEVKTATSCLGFRLKNPELGEFTDFNDVTYALGYVFYQHNRQGQQIISYTSHLMYDVTFYLVIDGLLIHDHQSVYTGGPAYATYYTERAANRTPEGS
ncbi:MAG: hypothetical protein ACXACY_19855 [Candidatus Hodarchaeales archaeon]|jgi:hypothetical protein